MFKRWVAAFRGKHSSKSDKHRLQDAPSGAPLAPESPQAEGGLSRPKGLSGLTGGRSTTAGSAGVSIQRAYTTIAPPPTEPPYDNPAALRDGSTIATSPSGASAAAAAAGGAAPAAVSGTAAATALVGGTNIGHPAIAGARHTNGHAHRSQRQQQQHAPPEPYATTPRDEDLGSCPPYAAKAVWGLRYTMEDKWAAVPNLVQVPAVLVMPQSKSSKLFSGGCGCGLPSPLGGRSADKNSEQARLMTKSYDNDVAMDSLHYFGVFDGHGGADAARHCAERMHALLEEALKAALAGAGTETATEDTAKSTSSSKSDNVLPSPATWIQQALGSTFLKVDEEFRVISEGTYVGTTAVVALAGSKRMWLAHCGDSRAVLCRKGVAQALTNDHKASRDDEVKRVQAAGGHVWWDRVMGELAVSRAIGDHCLRPYVIAEPESCLMDRSSDDEVLIMASDGLWDVLNNQEAADIALHTLASCSTPGVAAAKKAASALTKAALDRGTRDNVTVLVVDLRGRAEGDAPVAAGAQAAVPATAQ